MQHNCDVKKSRGGWIAVCSVCGSLTGTAPYATREIAKRRAIIHAEVWARIAQETHD